MIALGTDERRRVRAKMNEITPEPPGLGLPWPQSIRAAIRVIGAKPITRMLGVSRGTVEYWRDEAQGPPARRFHRALAALFPGWGELEITGGAVDGVERRQLSQQESACLKAFGEYLTHRAAELWDRPISPSRLDFARHEQRMVQYRRRAREGGPLFPESKVDW